MTLNSTDVPVTSGLLSTRATRNGPARLGSRLRRAIALVALGDALVLSATVTLAWQLRFLVEFNTVGGVEGWALAAKAVPAIVITWFALLTICGAHSRRVFGAGTEEYRAVLVASSATAGAAGLFCYLASLDLSRGFLLLTFLLATPSLIAFRYVARLRVHRLRKRGHLVHRVIAVGGASDIDEITDILARESHLGYEVIGGCTPDGLAGDDSRVPVVGQVVNVRDVCTRLGADTVLVTRGGYHRGEDLRRIAWDLEGSNLQLIVVPSLTEVAGPRIHMRPVAGLPLIHLQEPQSDNAGGLTKRIFDVAGSLLAIALLSPLMLIVTVAIRLEDGGSIVFRQRRIGWKGEAFPCFKFRSMIADAEKSERVLREAEGHVGALWKSETDPRITRVGSFIRRYSLDELPQLFNVLLGHMSLVGPRPQQAWEVETYTADARRRLLVRPGMTGLWQVSGRSNLSFDEAVRLDLYYVDNWSLATDLVIMAKTAKAVLSSDGAY